MRIHGLLVLWIVIISGACTKELDIPFPQAEEQLVLNGILHPDSIIKVSLTKTLAIKNTGNQFPLVKDAIIRLYENEVLLGEPEFDDSIYVFDYYPKVGMEYRVEAEVPGFPTLKASDMMPEKPIAKICYQDDPLLRKSIAVNILDNIKKHNTYWLSATMVNSRFSICGEGNRCDVKQPYFRSFSNIPDRFNAYVDNISNGVTEYDSYIRIENKALNDHAIELVVESYFIIENLTSDETYRFDILNTTLHFDKFLKSSILYMRNYANYSYDEDFAVTPFAEIIQTYSNVENGTGIFAAYNSMSIAVEDHPCK